MRRALLTAAVLALVLAPAAGRADEPPTRFCTAMGCTSGVAVRMQELSSIHGASNVRVCVNSTCRTTTPNRQRIRVDAPGLSGEARASVRVTVRDRDGRTVLRLSRRVALRKWTPNGPDCPPTCWSRTLRIDLQKHALTAED